jgi:site-specific DNA-adenine methylase
MTKRLRPMFPYYGSKWRLAPKYPKPVYDTIIEPFAGSACYSLAYPDRNIRLYDKDPKIVGVWDFLIKATRKDIEDLPWDFEDVRDLNIHQEAKWFIGFWLNVGSASPRNKYSAWAKAFPDKNNWRNPRIRDRVANQVQHIKHWRVSEKDYRDVLPRESTWFIDPPYQEAGKIYRHASTDIDFIDLSQWCRRKGMGQVMVCENEGADWLPFKAFATTKGSVRKSKEVIWTND